MDHHAHHAPKQDDSLFTVNRVLTGLAIGTAVAGAGIILAPHILPALGYGSAEMAEEAMFVLHTSVEAGGSGWAGIANSALSAVPLIGRKLAEGGLFNAAATAVTGIGGVLLGNFVEKNEDGKSGLKWGKIIKYAALATSALIALPTVLTALGTGLIYLSTLNGDVDLAIQAIGLVDKTLGTAGTMNHELMGFSGLAAVAPHFMTCGMAMVPTAVSLFLSRNKKSHAKGHAHHGLPRQQKYTDGSITATMETDKPLAAGQPCHARLRLTHTHSGLPVTADELAVVHTKKLHLFVVDSSLKDYHHVHPELTQEAGVLAFSFTPKTSSDYSAWADFTLLKDRTNHKLKTRMASASGRNVKPSIRINHITEQSGLHFAMALSQPLQQGQASYADVTVADKNGNPVSDLEPLMGAFAHLVGFSADGKSIIHTHPLGHEPVQEIERGSGRLRFHIEPDCEGPAQFYLQIKRGGQEIYVPFGQLIKPPALAAQRVHIHHSATQGYAL